MNKGIKFRIYPNKSQQSLINQTLGCCRLIYNKGLSLRKESFENGLSIGYKETSAMLTELKKDEIDNFLNTTYMKILKDNLSALSTDIKEIRLINTEDIKNITGLDTIELDTTIENVDWLYTEKTVIGSTSSNNLPLCIGKHDELEAGKLSEVETEDLLPVRPVITISKDYIRS